MTDLAEAMRATSIGRAIQRYCLVNHYGQHKLASDLGVSAQFMSQVAHDRKTLPDDRIPLLPDGLRQQVTEIRARRYEGMAAMVRHSSGIRKDKAS